MELKQVFEGLEGLPCHLTWLEELLSDKLGKGSSLEEKRAFVGTQWLAYCYKESDRGDEGEGDSGGDAEENSLLDRCDPEHNPRYAALFSRNLNQAVKGIYCETAGGLEEAKGKMKQMRGFLGELVGEHHGRLKEPLEYLVECLEWAISKMEGGGNEEALNVLQKKWEELEENPRSKAALVYMKATLRDSERRGKYVEEIKKVLELDPDYFIWRHFAYRALRVARLQVDKEATSGSYPKVFKAPSQEEIEMARRTFEVAGDSKPEMAKADMITMLWDCLMLTVYPKICPHAKVEPCPLKDTEQARQTLLQLSDELLEAAQNRTDEQTFLAKSVVRKADVLLLINSTEESRQQGLKLLQDTLEKCPRSSFLCWKLGTVFKKGVPDDKGLKNWNKALEYFCQALKLQRSDNYFKCVREYLSLLPKPPTRELVKEALAFLDKVEEGEMGGKPLIRWNLQKIDISFWRAGLLWCFAHYLEEQGGVEGNKKMACEELLGVWMKYPEHRNAILRNIRQPPFGRGPATEDLKTALQSLKWTGSLNKEEKEAVDGLMGNLENRFTSAGSYYRNRSKPGQMSVSASDSDQDWRRK